MSGHTPGPWVTHLGDPTARCDCETILAERACVATILWDRGDEHDWQYPSKETASANARLIASAPDLLAACESVVAARGLGTGWEDRIMTAHQLVDAAVKKARGET